MMMLTIKRCVILFCSLLFHVRSSSLLPWLTFWQTDRNSKSERKFNIELFFFRFSHFERLFKWAFCRCQCIDHHEFNNVLDSFLTRQKNWVACKMQKLQKFTDLKWKYVSTIAQSIIFIIMHRKEKKQKTKISHQLKEV